MASVQCENCEKNNCGAGLANMGCRHRGGGALGGVFPSPIGVAPGEGAVPPPQKNFNFLAKSCILAFILTTIASSA